MHEFNIQYYQKVIQYLLLSDRRIIQRFSFVIFYLILRERRESHANGNKIS